MVNVILRLAWVQSVFGFNPAPFIHKKILSAIVASLEIFRRGMWNFFRYMLYLFLLSHSSRIHAYQILMEKKNDFLLIRVENEHLNNVGKYRAFKSVPLPFNYEEEDKDA